MAEDTNTQLEKGTPEYDAEMAKRGEAVLNAGNTHKVTSGEEPTKVEEKKDIPPKPAYVPDKFYNAETGEVNYEALAKSYQELEKQRSQAPKADNKETKQQEVPKAEADKATEDDQDAATKAVEQAGLNMADLSREFTEQGSLSEQSYESLAKVGIPKETVDAYIAGQQALAQQAKQAAFSLTDGEQNYTAMIGWAAANLSQEEIDAYNMQTASMNSGIRETAIRGLFARYAAETGANEKPLVGGKTTAASNVQGYTTTAQMMEAMNDKRYRTDPAYREQVAQKIARSNF